MIDLLKANISTEIGMLQEIVKYQEALKKAEELEKKQLMEVIESLRKSMGIINKSLPEIIKNISLANSLTGKSITTNLEKVSVSVQNSKINVALNKEDKGHFLNELSISQNLIKKLRDRKEEAVEDSAGFTGARGYLKLSNRIFLDLAQKIIGKGYFRDLSINIKRANMNVLFETYVAMIFFTTFLSVFAALAIILFLTFFKIGFLFPWISYYQGDFLLRFIKFLGLIVVIPVATFFLLYWYPSTERDSIARRIEQELPFAVIHMGAISGSEIAPVEIFRIIGSGEEYPSLRKEIRKVLNQINIYGYDLVTSLGNVSKNTPSQKLGELFNGLSTTINSGGNLTDFFQKRAETLLLDYRIEREKFNRLAETFMDIYISVVIATPMILMLLLIMISITGFDTGFSTNQLAFIIISVVALINVLFLGFLRIKQPSY